MNTVDYLKAARAFIVRGWVQGPLAVDSTGLAVPPHSSNAVAWDMMGSIYAAGKEAGPHPQQHREAMEAIRMQIPPMPTMQLSTFNDASGRTKEEILDVFDKAIAMASEPVGAFTIQERAAAEYEKFKRETGKA